MLPPRLTRCNGGHTSTGQGGKRRKRAYFSGEGGKERGRTTKGDKREERRREWTEREAKGIPPKVNVSRINTGMTGWSDHWESLKKSCLVMYNIKRWSKQL